MTILATIVLLGVLIFVHELGHFWAAKAVGVGVERFSIGLGPRIWGFERGGTEYVLAAIPLGGYVKMQGMEDEVMEHLEGGRGDAPRRPREGDFDGRPIWARAFVISAGVAMNMLFAFVLYTSVAAFWGYRDMATTRVMAVDETSLPAGTEALAGLTPGAEIVGVGPVVPELWGDVRRGLVDAVPGPLTVETVDPSARFEIRIPEDPDARLALAGALQYWIDAVVGRVEPGTPAADASMEAGDRVTSVAGVPVANWAEMVREIGARPGERVEIGVLRGETPLVRAVELESVGDGEEERGRLGVVQTLPEVAVPVRPGQAVAAGWDETVGITRLILGFLGDLVTGSVSPRDVGSIGTIAVASGEAASQGVATFLRFMALFSVNLAILNMLPIPVLDGGHMVFLGIELVRGEKLSVKQRIRWSKVGVWVVLGIMVWALGNDLLRFLGL
ncbi:MAG: RIP metalloprotease RseP [Gemmatimonadetes bacterium]|nr:RIP metalloprotease RseP [Gemmatimonadota bacterium]MXX70319.1 RIP metalloprotease RseP [Gemmatimonadota bacterium]MYC91527.1 RIP metalloprotease RseP [Gemmatimonadota bacterium]MYG34211.1 RIP metalloprotease RseP [Gemmatimonadota bacterium]